MTPEELLKPRRISILTDTYVKYGKEDVLEYEYTEGDAPHDIKRLEKKMTRNGFKKLEWWELRDINDMPEYVVVTGRIDTKNEFTYCKVKKHLTTGCIVEVRWSEDLILDYAAEKILPSTKEEYDNYLKEYNKKLLS